jgi:hypothetical protein
MLELECLFVNGSSLTSFRSPHRRVIQLNELSRKMETIQEQVLPFEGPQGISDDVIIKDMVEAEVAAPPTETPETGHGHHKKGHKAHAASMPAPHQSSTWQHDGHTPVMPPDRLQNFYRRYNKILLDNVAINKEKERLQMENAQLQDLIQQYIQGTQLSDDTLAGDNPLFVVNGRYGNVSYLRMLCCWVVTYFADRYCAL